jgi:aryl-alcohol dehydrogenase-like predicted oxidoreductase/spore coat polysaccharide biosynthesis protein SpsF (cytidylyltransferase family)
VATSNDSSDDALARLVEEAGLRCFRGSLHNTLERFVTALVSFDDDTVVLRLVADNVFPDGKFIEEVEADFITRNLEYLICNGEPSGVPFGLCVEVTRLKHLREALQNTTAQSDLKHVTPYVKRKFGDQYSQRYKHLAKGHFRCTIDCLDDYLGMQKVFDEVEDPVNISSLELVERLASTPYQPIVSKPVSQLVLGGAQLGMRYGIANVEGQPSRESSTTLLKTAISSGVRFLDTAPAYGSSEQLIGSLLAEGWGERVSVITKLSTLDACPPGAKRRSVHAFVDASVYQSCAALGRPSLDVLMLHRATHLHAWDGAVWQRLLHLRDLGVVRSLGVSVQNPRELTWSLSASGIEIIQFPFNAFDWRWGKAVTGLTAAKARRTLTVHVRSSLLQGLLTTDDPALWRRARVPENLRPSKWLNDWARRLGRDNVVDLCLAFVRAQPWVDGVVVGIETQSQLLDNLRYFDRPPLSADDVRVLERTRPTLSATSLNPANWQRW